MTKIEALELELAARKMVEGTGLDWGQVIRHTANKLPPIASLIEIPIDLIELALGIIEDKPVWKECRVFAYGIPVVIKQDFKGRFTLADGTRIDKEVLSWNPSKPKTVNPQKTINFRERLTANAEDFDNIISLILAENSELRKALENLPWNPPNPKTVMVEIPSARPGERYLGSIIEPSGRVRHTFLMPGDEKKNWSEGMEWAKSFGGDLPDRIEQAMFLAHMPEEFQKEAYWSNTQHAYYSYDACYQGFDYGHQDNGSKSCELRVRPVRRVYIEENLK